MSILLTDNERYDISHHKSIIRVMKANIGTLLTVVSVDATAAITVRRVLQYCSRWTVLQATWNSILATVIPFSLRCSSWCCYWVSGFGASWSITARDLHRRRTNRRLSRMSSRVAKLLAWVELMLIHAHVSVLLWTRDDFLNELWKKVLISYLFWTL